MTIIDKIVFSQNTPAKNTLWAKPSEKGTELLIFNKGKWGIVGADALTELDERVDNNTSGISSLNSGKEDKTSIESVATGSVALSADVSKYYTFVDAIETFAITLPSPTDVTKVQTIVFFMTIGTTPAITFNSTLPIYYHDGFGFVAGKTYEVNALFNGSAWIVTAVEIFVPEPEPITIVYKGDNASATNIMTKTINAFGDTYTLDEASITKMTLDDNKVTLTDFNIANLGQHGGTCDVYTYTFNDANEHTLKVWTNSSDMFRLSPWFGGPSPSQSAYFSSIKSVVIPNTITTIGAYAFGYCSGLASITIPDSVTSIGDEAFRYCSGLTSIEIPDSVTSIGDEAFGNCTSLTSVTIGDGVTSIGDEAFRYCSGLTSITSLAMTAPAILSYTFQGVKTNGTLYVPIGSSGYDVWMGTGNYYLGSSNWTKVEQ